MKRILSENEKKQLTQKSNKHREYRLLLNSIVKEKKLKLKDASFEAYEYKNLDFTVSILTMNISGGVKVYFVASDSSDFIDKAFASETVHKGEKVIVRGYRINEDTMIKDHEEEYSKEEYNLIIRDLNKKDEFLSEKEVDEDNNETKNILPCIYGNWCGPLCSGPDDPISPVDTCCMYHDQCYGENGYFNCDCDLEIIHCLARYYYMGSEWAIIITEYFIIQYETNCM